MIVTTTTCDFRYELLEQTYSSWKQNLKGIDLTAIPLFLNVDCYGDDVGKCLSVAKSYFDNVTIYCPSSPSFPMAIKRLWATLETDYVLHLEDDWVLQFETPISELLALMDDETIQVGFRAYERPNCFRDFILAPSIIRGTIAKEISKALDPTSPIANPEQQIRALNTFSHSRIYPMDPLDKILVRDIGREFIKGTNFCRNGKDDELKFTGYSIVDDNTDRTFEGYLANQEAMAISAAKKYK